MTLASLGTPAGRVRTVAVAEAISWAGLLLGMALKHGPADEEVGVSIFGPIHGAVFIAYVAVALVTWRQLRWSPGVAAAAVLAGIPPFATWVFERWAVRAGHLDSPDSLGTARSL